MRFFTSTRVPVKTGVPLSFYGLVTISGSFTSRQNIAKRHVFPLTSANLPAPIFTF